MFSFMYWTIPVAVLFVGIFLMLAGMTLWGHFSPPHRRKGFLGFVTDRSERLYMALITTALIMVASFTIDGSNAWVFLGVGAAVSAVMLKWG
jgi:predicted small integral membrane protein